MKNSCIKSFEKYTEKFIIYGMILTTPGMGKTPALNIIKNAIIQREQFLNIPMDESCLANG